MRGKKIPVLQTYQEKLEQKRDFQRSRNMYDTAVFVLDSSLSALLMRPLKMFTKLVS